jgi:cell filamentation protein
MAEDDPYIYPGTEVLRNRYGIRDGNALAAAEAQITARRIAQLADTPEPGAHDLAHLQAFHRRIFRDVYDWAGELRTIVISKGDTFAQPDHIESYRATVLSEIPAEHYLRGLSTEQTVSRLAYYLAEINAVQPFREGNGRTQRAFLQQLAADAGYHLDWTKLDCTRNIEASQAAHRGDEQPMLADLTFDREQLAVTELRDAASPTANRPASGNPVVARGRPRASSVKPERPRRPRP